MVAAFINTDVVPVYVNTWIVGSVEIAVLTAKTKIVSPTAYNQVGFEKEDILI